MIEPAPIRQQREAHLIYKRALDAGTLIRPKKCSRCGRSRKVVIHGHHPDYSKPLEVVWLCAGWHTEEHRRTNTGYKGRTRCAICNRYVWRHVQDSGDAVLIDGALAHAKCAKKMAVA